MFGLVKRTILTGKEFCESCLNELKKFLNTLVTRILSRLQNKKDLQKTL